MNKNLSALVIPAAVMILTVGFLLPIFNTIQEERCSLSFSEVIESDLLGNEAANHSLTDHAKAVAYLMKHPKQTLKNCLAFEAENPSSTKQELLLKLASNAYGKLRHRDLPTGLIDLNETIRNLDPKLYGELKAK